MNTPSDIDQLTQQIIKFRDDRDWEQFHGLKDLSIGLSIEAAELMELFLWKTPTEIEEFIAETENKTKVEDELADILIFGLLVAHKLNCDIKKIVSTKLQKNAKKYPVDKSKGLACKYNELIR